MKIEDFKFLRRNKPFRTEYRLTIYKCNGGSLRVGFNKESKAQEALEFFENLCKENQDFESVKMVRVPRVKGRISFSEAKKRRQKITIGGNGPEDLKAAFRTIFN